MDELWLGFAGSADAVNGVATVGLASGLSVPPVRRFEPPTAATPPPYHGRYPARLPDGRVLLLPPRQLPGAPDRAVASTISTQASVRFSRDGQTAGAPVKRSGGRSAPRTGPRDGRRRRLPPESILPQLRAQRGAITGLHGVSLTESLARGSRFTLFS